MPAWPSLEKEPEVKNTASNKNRWATSMYRYKAKCRRVLKLNEGRVTCADISFNGKVSVRGQAVRQEPQHNPLDVVSPAILAGKLDFLSN